MEMEGTIHSYFTEGRYGFISAQDGGTYYMHFNDLRDQHLRDSLDALMRLPGKTSVDFPVLFVDGGKTKSDAAYKAAKNVRLLV